MEKSKSSERRLTSFMQPEFKGPLQRAEEFAVSLRKKKKNDLIQKKRELLH